jgi:hypothetical protein
VVPPLSRVVVSPETLTVQISESAVLTAVAYDTSGAQAVSVPFAWSSSDGPGVVLTVNQTGRVSGISEGTAMVFVEADSLRDTSFVRVVPASRGWYAQLSGAGGANLNGVFFRPDGRNGWAVGEGGKIVRTRDAGAQWTTLVSGT